MPREFSRTLRVGEQIRRELAELIRNEVKDPRVGMVTISDVEVTKDLAHAKVFFSVLGSESDVAASAEGLHRAAGFLRRELGKVMRLRVVPELRFVYDDTQERGTRLSALIDQAVREDRAKHPESDSDDDGE